MSVIKITEEQICAQDWDCCRADSDLRNPQECHVTQFLDGDALRCLCEILQGIMNLEPGCCRDHTWIAKSCLVNGNTSSHLQPGHRTVRVSVCTVNSL